MEGGIRKLENSSSQNRSRPFSGSEKQRNEASSSSEKEVTDDLTVIADEPRCQERGEEENELSQPSLVSSLKQTGQPV